MSNIKSKFDMCGTPANNRLIKNQLILSSTPMHTRRYLSRMPCLRVRRKMDRKLSPTARFVLRNASSSSQRHLTTFNIHHSSKHSYWPLILTRSVHQPSTGNERTPSYRFWPAPPPVKLWRGGTRSNSVSHLQLFS